MDALDSIEPAGFRLASADAHRAHWRRVCTIAYLLLGRRDGGYRTIRDRLDALRPAPSLGRAGWERFPPEWFDELDAVERDATQLVRRPVAAHAGRRRRSMELANMIAELVTAYEQLRPNVNRAAWIAAKAKCSVSKVEKALALARRQAEA